MKVLIFLRQTEGKSNWKIDTISVVQELILGMAADSNGRISKSTNSEQSEKYGSR